MDIIFKELELQTKGDYFIIKFNLNVDNEKEYSCWSTIYKKKGIHYFNDAIYVYDQDKYDALDFLWGKGYKKFPLPIAYYNEDRTREILEGLYSHSEFQKYIKNRKFKFRKDNLYYSKPIKKRERYMKKIIEIAFSRDEMIGIVLGGNKGYVPLSAIEPGIHLIQSLPEGSRFRDRFGTVSELLENAEQYKLTKKEILGHAMKLKKQLDMIIDEHNEEIIKYNSFVWDYIDIEGNIKDAEEMLMAWEIPEDSIFYDEIFTDDSMVRLTEQLLNGNESVISTFPSELVDPYYVMDTIIEDHTEYFYLYDLKKDWEEYRDEVEKIIIAYS